MIMDKLIWDTSLTGDPCQRWTKRNLYPNDVGLASRGDGVVEAAVAASVAVLLLRIPTNRNSYRIKKNTSLLSRCSGNERTPMINILMVQENMAMHTINLVDTTVRIIIIRKGAPDW